MRKLLLSKLRADSCTSKNCRKRHVKCDFNPNTEEPCDGCRETGKTCEWSRPIRFQAVTFEQPARSTKRTLSDLHGDGSQDGNIVSPASATSAIETSISSREEPHQADQITFDVQTFPVLASPQTSEYSLHRTGTNTSLDLPCLIPGRSHSIPPHISSYALLPFKTKHEAEYFLHFKRDLALWLDICDHQCHFAIDVPRRATSSRLLLQSIYAYGAQHISILRNSDDLAPYQYYNEALSLLIPLLNNPDSTLSDELLAAIVILRSYEEFSQADLGTHLFGSARLLDHLSSPASPGTWQSMSEFSKAARWVILRQWIYFAFTRSESMRLRLDLYTTLIAQEGDRDDLWCNRAILLFARVIESSCKPQGMDPIEWKELHEENEKWFEHKPYSFMPIWDEPPPSESSSVFPVVWCREDVHLIGLQHYYLSKTVLAIFDPQLNKPGFDSFKKRKHADDVVLKSIKYVVGIATSNSVVVPAYFHACHILQKCGYYVRDAEDRQRTLQFLSDFVQKTQWPMIEKVRRQLEQQWESE